MANPTLANDTENNLKGETEILQEVAVNQRSHLSEANKEGYIHNKLLKFRLQTQLLIIIKKNPCIMTINLLCSVHVNDESNIHL